MKVLLIQSWLGRKQHPVLPLGLACVASALDGHSLRIADPNVHSNPVEYLKALLHEYKPDAVGLSLRNCDTTSYTDRYSYLHAFAEQAKLIKSLLPDVYLMAGGAGFSIFAPEIMEGSPSVDCGVTGHGEAVVRDLLENRSRGIHSGSSGFFSEPRVDLLDTDAYIPYQRNLSVGVEVNRGCNRSCSYCSYGDISGRRVMERNTHSIIREVASHTENGVKHIFLVAPILNSSRERGETVMKALASSGLKVTWEAYHTAKSFDDSYALLAYSSGCRGVSFSPDGGTEDQMKLAGKDYTVKQLEKGVVSASSAGIDVSINIFPWWRETGFLGMLKAFRNGSRWGTLGGDRLKRLRFSLVRRMPGTPFAPASPFPDPGEFDRPPGWGTTVFLVLKRLLERDRTR